MQGETLNPDAATRQPRLSEFCVWCSAWRGSLGLEPTPDLYVQHIVQVFREVKRVLRDDGTLWLNLGDSYFGTGKGPTPPTGIHGENGIPYPTVGVYSDPVLKPKDLVGIPWRVAFALQADGWWLRSDIIWSKPNPMPESVTDRPTKAHEYLFLMAKSARYYYDAEAISEALVSDPDSWGRHSQKDPGLAAPTPRPMFGPDRDGRDGTDWGNRATRNRRTVWEIPTEAFPEAHFATFPQALVLPCIQAGSKPDDVVLDPFCGSGTTGLVALANGRRFLGIELNPDYCEMARRRIDRELPLLVR
jgi:DNA modification methylase